MRWPRHWRWFFVAFFVMPVDWLAPSWVFYIVVATLPLTLAAVMVLHRLWLRYRFPAYDPTKHELRDD